MAFLCVIGLSHRTAPLDVREKMAAEGSEPIGNTPAEFRDYLKVENERWTRLAREINLRLE